MHNVDATEDLPGPVLNEQLLPEHRPDKPEEACGVFAVMAAQFFSLSALASTSELPAAVAKEPALRKSPTLVSLTPPVGSNSMCGSGALTDLI